MVTLAPTGSGSRTCAVSARACRTTLVTAPRPIGYAAPPAPVRAPESGRDGDELVVGLSASRRRRRRSARPRGPPRRVRPRPEAVHGSPHLLDAGVHLREPAEQRSCPGAAAAPMAPRPSETPASAGPSPSCRSRRTGRVPSVGSRPAHRGSAGAPGSAGPWSATERIPSTEDPSSRSRHADRGNHGRPADEQPGYRPLPSHVPAAMASRRSSSPLNVAAVLDSPREG